jgi:ADP-heptose:LPS heptosyltransferase
MSDRYLIVRTSSLGDIVHALPALTALRKHRPDASIRWVVGACLRRAVRAGRAWTISPSELVRTIR